MPLRRPGVVVVFAQTAGPAAAAAAVRSPPSAAADTVDASPASGGHRRRSPPASLALLPSSGSAPGSGSGSPAGGGGGGGGGGLRSAAALVKSPMKRRLKRLFTLSDSSDPDQSHSDSEESGGEDRWVAGSSFRRYVKLAVHWLRVSAVLAEFNRCCYRCYGLGASARIPIAAKVKFSDDCAHA